MPLNKRHEIAIYRDRNPRHLHIFLAAATDRPEHIGNDTHKQQHTICPPY